MYGFYIRLYYLVILHMTCFIIPYSLYHNIAYHGILYYAVWQHVRVPYIVLCSVLVYPILWVAVV